MLIIPEGIKISEAEARECELKACLRHTGRTCLKKSKGGETGMKIASKVTLGIVQTKK